MFAQIMEGRAADPEGIRRLTERWMVELSAGAEGFLGHTGGITDDGRVVMMARFATEEAARANSDRPEQGRWWAEMEKCFDGPVAFADSTDVELLRGGGSDDAGFVQVMKDHGADRAAIRELDELFEREGGGFRPDLLGGVRVWTAPDAYVEFAYFTNESEAREGERSEPPPHLADAFSRYGELMAGVEFLDIREPQLHSR